jgi:putative DNA primase/helicase
VAELPNPLTYPLSDTGNGELLAALYGDRLRYVCDKGPWLVWDGTRWRHERKGEATLAAIEVARARQLAAVAEPDPKRARQIEQFGLRSESGRALRETLTCASHIAPIPLERQELDADPWLLGCHNGTLDLRTGQLRAGRQADLITRSCGAAYDPEARAPRWTRFLREITGGDEELLRYLALAAGYSLTADTREQVFFICLGHGANGKSTFLNALRAVAGDYGGHAAGSCFELREFGEGIPTDLAMLNGLRFVTAGETSQGRRLHEQRVKEVTGGDPITARKLYMDHSTFIPGLKLWMATNYRPEIRGTDAGIWRRVRVIPFRANFEDRAERDLGRALLDELPGILAWAVRGCLAWQEEGLPTPAAVADATGEYRDETDPLGRFLSMCVRPCPGGRVGASTLYDRYLRWCREDAQTAPLTRTKFGMEMVSRGLRRERAGGLKFYLDVMIDEDAA